MSKYHEDNGCHLNWSILLIYGTLSVIIGGIAFGIWIAARLLALGGW